MDYGLGADSLRTGYGLYTDSLQTDYDLFTHCLRTTPCEHKKQHYYHKTDLPSFPCDGGEVGRFFVNPGLLVMFHNGPKLSEKMFL